MSRAEGLNQALISRLTTILCFRLNCFCHRERSGRGRADFDFQEEIVKAEAVINSGSFSSTKRRKLSFLRPGQNPSLHLTVLTEYKSFQIKV